MLDRDEFLQNLRAHRHHAYILLGDKGSGKKMYAFEMAKELLETIDLTKHPDFVYIEPTKTSIGIDEMRMIKSRLNTKPYGKLRVVFIDRADIMTIQAQNSMLKTLEETDETVFILTCEKEMLPTIMSRCYIVQMGRKSFNELEAILCRRGINQEDAALFSALSEGKLSRALAFAEDINLWTLREQSLEQLASFLLEGNPSVYVFEFLQQNKENFEEITNFFLSLLRDMLVLKTGNHELIINKDYTKVIEDGARNFTFMRLQDIIEYVYEAKKQAKQNANYALLVESLLLNIGG